MRSRNGNQMMKRSLAFIGLLTLFVEVTGLGQRPVPKPAPVTPLHEINQVAQPAENHVVAIVGATLIDGRGGTPILDSIVLVRGDKIVSAGKRSNDVPTGAEVIEAKGLTLLPGLIDSHFHIDGDDPLPALYLTHGITSV